MSQPATQNTAVVLLSGGLDSTVALADTLTRQRVVCTLTFDYGQRAASKERAAARAIANHYKLPHKEIALPWLAELLPVAMTPSFAMSGAKRGAAERPMTQDEWFDVTQVWVPNRNGVLLNIAASYAEAMGAAAVVYGANAEEGATFPDNTVAFRDKLNEALAFSTLSGVRVETPVGRLAKTEIVQRGLELDVPFQFIWSCYQGLEEQCGQCSSCLRVKQARDQVSYISGKMAAIPFKES
ncbi:MAG TPA: 7-cyano-7-deazaguanine synthase QueC [Coleofasciculaceae cyanobacterium]|jgi:7-cyano-7-deazaguanine synthase